jgi:hypothetical protein
MAVVVSCPSCGQFASIPEELAGQAVQCPHCQGLMAVLETDGTPSGSTQSRVAEPTTHVKRRTQKKSPILAAMLYGGATLLAIIGAAWLVKHQNALRTAQRPRPPDMRMAQASPATRRVISRNLAASQPTVSKWEIGYGPRLRELRQQAEDARQAGDLPTASMKYRDLFALADKIPVAERSPQLRDELATLRADWKGILDQMQSHAVLSSATPLVASRTEATDTVEAVHTSTVPTGNEDQRSGGEADLLPNPANAAQDAHQAIAFAVDATHLVTAAAPLARAKSVHIEDAQGGMLSAKVTATDADLALLELDHASIPEQGLNYLNLADDVATTGVRCAAIPEAKLFAPTPELLMADVRTPPAAPREWRVSLAKHPRLAGAPLIDATGDIIGVVLAQHDDPRTRLPALPVQVLRDFLSVHHALPDARCANPDPLAVFQVSAGKE